MLLLVFVRLKPDQSKKMLVFVACLFLLVNIFVCLLFLIAECLESMGRWLGVLYCRPWSLAHAKNTVIRLDLPGLFSL